MPLLNAKWVRRGLELSESLLPYFQSHQHCFSLLCDYFAFPEKFLFLYLTGINFPALPRAKEFSLTFYLNCDVRENIKISKESFVLHATPAVNLWKGDAEPIWHESQKIHYLLRAQSPFPGAAIHSLSQVRGWSESKKNHFEYVPVSHFPVEQKEVRRFQTLLKPSVIEDDPEVYLELWNPDSLLEDEVISPEVLLYQPQAFLEVNGPQLLKAAIPVEGLDFQNLLPLSAPIYPPLHENVAWKVITHLALRFKNLSELSTLKQLIISYDFSSFRVGSSLSLGRKIADALLGCHTSSHQHFYQGELIQGYRSILKLKEDIFLNRGEVHLFGSILALILAEHAPFNSFHELEIQGILTGIHFKWPAAIS